MKTNMLNITPGARGWLNITTIPDDVETIRSAVKTIEIALGDRANWVAYDEESPVITVKLVRDRPDNEIIQQAIELLSRVENVHVENT